MLLANCIPFWIAASDSSEPSVGSRICLNIVTSLSSHSTEYGFCSWSLASKKRPADPGKKLPKRLALNSSLHFPLRWNGLRSLIWPQIMPEAVSMMGGGYLRGDKYHTRIVCQDIHISAQDSIEDATFQSYPVRVDCLI